MHTHTPKNLPTLVSMAEITCRGISKSHVYDLVREGRFPAPAIRLGTRFTRWSASAVDEWFADPVRWMDSKGVAV